MTDLLSAHLLGSVQGQQGDDLDKHLATCPSCLQAAHKLQAEDELTDAMRAERVAWLGSPADVEAVIERGRRLCSEIDTAPLVETEVFHSPDSRETIDFLRPAEQGDELGRLGGYRVLAVMGVGGMGVVFSAEDPKLKRLVALKAMKPAVAASNQGKDRFLREAQAAAAIAHDNIVTIYQVGEDGGVLFIAMQFLRGESLQTRLRRKGKLDQRDVARIGRQVAAGLMAAHNRGMIHRDIKPDNIWLEEGSHRVKILDFGLVRSVRENDRLTHVDSVLGTPRYMAPEQVQGRDVDHRADLFSLGSVLYHLASGKPPFEGGNLTAILLKVSQVQYEPIRAVCPNLRPGLARLITQLLSKEPDERPQSARAVEEALSSIEDALEVGQAPSTSTAVGELSATTDHSPIAEGESSPTRRRLGWWGLTFVLTVVVLGAGFLLQRAFNKPSPATTSQGDSLVAATKDPPSRTRYRGKVDVLVERSIGGEIHLLRLNDPEALPLQKNDKFRIEGEVDPPAYLYVVWVDPQHDVTPVYPWDPTVGWESRPAQEEPTGTVSLPPGKANRYRVPDAAPGVATIVLFACSTPLQASDTEVKEWFEQLPNLDLPAGGEKSAVWFDNYAEVREASRLRSFGIVETNDPFARWQGQLQALLEKKTVFQTSITFARTNDLSIGR